MLRGLEIKDILIIDHLELEFQPGLNVLTGETGAGKSILLDALGFVLGWRGRADLVRAGAAQGEVTAVFDLAPGHPAHSLLEEAGMQAEDGELILRRINTPEGRKTAWVNGRRAPGDLLRQLSACLVELHGQHDDRGLLNARGHRKLLDSFAKSDKAIEKCSRGWAGRRAAKAALEAAEKAAALLREEEEFLRHAAAEMADLSPEVGEDAALDTARRSMQAGLRVHEEVVRAHVLLQPNGVEQQVLEAQRWLDGAAKEADGLLDAPIEALSRALNALAEAEQGVSASLNIFDHDPLELERTEERLFAIRALARKHEVLPDELAAFGQNLQERLAALERSGDDLATLRAELAQAETSYQTAADGLTALRIKAARRLEKAMAGELAPLKMERAVFTISVVTGPAGPTGQDAVIFLAATNPGAPSGPLDKIASGGELSRFLLALKVCLTGGGDGLTLIFDEIDRGVGGATADAVGRRLSELAATGQVLAVTHSPQVGARGQHHWRVEKHVKNGQTRSQVVPLDAAQRVDEIARMLSGDSVTDAARAAAQTLLAG